jgi:hypothetical protein
MESAGKGIVDGRAPSGDHFIVGHGLIVNPFLLDWSRRAGRALAHHNPMGPFKRE